MAVADLATRRFDFGRIFRRTFDVIAGNFGPFAALGFAATLPGTINLVLTAAGLLPTVSFQDNPHGLSLYIIGAAFSVVGGFFLSLVLQAAVTYVAICFLNGQPAPLGSAIAVGMRQFLPLLAIAVLEALGLAGGVLLLLFPAVMLYVMWCVAVPARVAENTSISASFSRSSDLTSGYRWPIFGALVVLALGGIAVQYGVIPVMSVTVAIGVPAMAYAGAALSSVISSLVAVVSATLHASIYYELRVVKEGVGPAQIASVFD